MIAIKYNLQTKKICGTISTSIYSDLETNCEWGEGIIIIPHNHIILGEKQEYWSVETNEQGINILKRKSDKEIKLIEEEEKTKRNKNLDIYEQQNSINILNLLTCLNEIRQKLGLNVITLELLTTETINKQNGTT